ncbi:beta-lactamase [Bradyrhizobiaceae bacterium SG-6C]|nr:beta-lactamase [Bradyrhizobiaceae bacterium SG-6C]
MTFLSALCRLRMAAAICVLITGTAAKAEVSGAASVSPCGPSFSQSGPDAEAYGAGRNYPLGTIADRAKQEYMVATFSNFDKLLPAHAVLPPAEPSPLARACDSGGWRYDFDGERRTIDQYLARHPATGLLIARDSTILFERYQYGRRDTDRLLSNSMVKTMVAMLVGIAIKEGKIRSVEDLAQDYMPEMKGSAYGQTSLRALLTMSAGIAFSERYDGTDDAFAFSRDLRRSDLPNAANLLRRYSARDAPPETKFAYAGTQTETLGLVLTAATGKRLADYLSEKIWKPMGAEDEASWTVDGHNQEQAYCCLAARLRDYARFGLLLARDGGSVIPQAWVIEATTAPEGSFRAPRVATPFYGYGYQTWIMPAKRRMFAMLGTNGQAIFVDPASKLVLVHTAVRLKPNRDPAARELTALWFGLVRELGVAAAR